MASETVTPNGRRRVRAPKKKRDTAALQEGRRKSHALAPRLPDGRMVPGYRFKEILSAHDRHGLKPHTYDDDKIRNKPLFMKDPSIRKRLIKYIKKGYPYTTVCRFVGIRRDTFIDWLIKGKEGHPLYEDFYFAVAKAEAKGEMTILEDLRKHSRSEWKVSAWQLERRWPEHWSKIDRTRAEVQVQGEISVRHKEDLGQMVTDDPHSRELARKLLEGEEFGYQRKEDIDDAEFEDVEEEV